MFKYQINSRSCWYDPLRQRTKEHKAQQKRREQVFLPNRVNDIIKYVKSLWNHT